MKERIYGEERERCREGAKKRNVLFGFVKGNQIRKLFSRVFEMSVDELF